MADTPLVFSITLISTREITTESSEDSKGKVLASEGINEALSSNSLVAIVSCSTSNWDITTRPSSFSYNQRSLIKSTRKLESFTSFETALISRSATAWVIVPGVTVHTNVIHLIKDWMPSGVNDGSTFLDTDGLFNTSSTHTTQTITDSVNDITTHTITLSEFTTTTDTDDNIRVVLSDLDSEFDLVSVVTDVRVQPSDIYDFKTSLSGELSNVFIEFIGNQTSMSGLAHDDIKELSLELNSGSSSRTKLVRIDVRAEGKTTSSVSVGNHVIDHILDLAGINLGCHQGETSNEEYDNYGSCHVCKL